MNETRRIRGRNTTAKKKAPQVPVHEAAGKLTHKQIVEGMRELRKRVKPDPMSVREMVREGRPRESGATLKTRVARAQKRLRRFIEPGRSLSKELIAERRLAARHE